MWARRGFGVILHGKGGFIFYTYPFNRIIIQVKVGDKGPFNMLLDTGTDPSAIDLTAAKEIRLKLDPLGRKGAGGGTSRFLGLYLL